MNNHFTPTMNILCLFFAVAPPLFVKSLCDQVLTGERQHNCHPDKINRVYEENAKGLGKSIAGERELIVDKLTNEVDQNLYQCAPINHDNEDEHFIEIRMFSNDPFEFSVGIFLFQKMFYFKRMPG